MKTVRKNSKRHAAIFAEATKGASYRPVSDAIEGKSFSEMDVEHIRNGFRDRVLFLGAKVIDEGGGKFWIHFHSNHWAYIWSPA